jgi:outer membrane lipoprotein-sorting protein
MFFKIIFVIFFFFFLSSFSFSLESLAVEFVREVTRDQKTEKTAGVIYYTPQKTILEITHPLNQWMILKAGEIIIYYPDEKKAVKIKSSGPVQLPFLQSFLGVIEGNMGLSSLGFKLKESKIKGDLLLTYWQPPAELEKSWGECVLIFEKNKIISSEFKTPAGKVFIKTSYRQHQVYQNMFFPLEVAITQFLKTGPVKEKINYSNPSFDQSFPPKIINFSLPAEVEMKELEW